MKSLLPIILVVLLLTGAITYALSKRVIVKTDVNHIGIAANLLDSTIDNSKTDKAKTSLDFLTPTPTAKVTPTPTPTVKVTPTPTPEVKTDLPVTTEKGGVVASTTKVTKTTKTIVCTPVYGQANTCTEHIVVDTGAADSIFFNFAGLTYIAGLASFIKAKSLKK